MISSPSHEEHIKVLDNEFGLGVKYTKPLIEVSFNKHNSGKLLHLTNRW